MGADLEVIGRYRVIRPLGQGGMGRVYLAHDATLERDVAIKLLHFDPESGGLATEAKALAALSHPGIVTIFEIGAYDGQDFIAMEYLRGRALRDVLLDRPERARLVAICARVVTAVRAAHRANILHLDLKPENVVVGDGSEVKVVDFGIARRMDRVTKHRRARTARDVVELLATLPSAREGADTEVPTNLLTDVTQTAWGTPAYMAPEVLRGEPATPASDVYSLGVMFYECLTGERPYEGSLIEIIAQQLEYPAPPLADSLGPLVDRMLAKEPADRPTLEEIEHALIERPSPVIPDSRPRRWWWPLAAIAGALAIGGIGWWLAGQLEPEPPRGPAPLVTATIAIAPIHVDWPTYGSENASAAAVGDTLARTVGELSGAQIHGIATRDRKTAEATQHATHFVDGAIVERGGTLTAKLTLLELASGKPTTIESSVATPEIARLLDNVATKIADALGPGIALDRAPNRVRADPLLQAGKREIARAHYADARSYLDQAVDADPSFADAWYQRAIALSWLDPPQDLLHAVTERAFELTPPGPKKELMRAVVHYHYQRFTEMRHVLEPLETATGPDLPDRQELLYFLGEANWHDGRHAAGFRYFAEALDLDPDFRPASHHALQYTIARRMPEATRYAALARESPDFVEFSQGHYEALAATGTPNLRVAALLVLGRPIPPDLADRIDGDSLDARPRAIALAIAAGNQNRGRELIAALWQNEIAGRDPAVLPDALYDTVGRIGEVTISAGMKEETAKIVSFCVAGGRPRPARDFQRLSIAAAPILGDAKVMFRENASERFAKLIAASEAELAGDRAKAASLLAELVADPTYGWDYVERAALARNLRALGRTRERAALCEDTLKPAVFQPAFLVLRAICRAK